jgi:hypothetical protein
MPPEPARETRALRGINVPSAGFVSGFLVVNPLANSLILSMSLEDAVVQILGQSPKALPPSEIRDQIKLKFPALYGTERQRTYLAKGHFNSLDHALTAEIYKLVRRNEDFLCDDTARPMRISLASGSENAEDDQVGEDYDSASGILYVLGTSTFTESQKEIVKIGITTRSLEQRIKQLYTTGVPFRFRCLKSYSVQGFASLEKALHNLLTPFRLNDGREFFTDDAVPFVDRVVAIHAEIRSGRS